VPRATLTVLTAGQEAGYIRTFRMCGAGSAGPVYPPHFPFAMTTEADGRAAERGAPRGERREGEQDRRDVPAANSERTLVLQVVQPGLLGLMDGSVSTLAPLFATAALTHRSAAAFFVGLAASVGAGISMGLAEALSDDGIISGRGKPLLRGAITGAGTVLGGMLHTLPFLIADLPTALRFAYAVVVVELIMIASIRYRYMGSPLGRTVIQVIGGGGLVFAIGVWLGRMGAAA
jgi:hypothetical protein